MAKKKRKSSKKKGTPRRVKALAWMLVVVLVAGVAGVKFFKSSRGHLFLLGKGFSEYYVTAQESVDVALRDAVSALGLTGALTMKRGGITVAGERFSLLKWRIACGEGCDLVMINLALSRAARSRGASVLASREEADGRELLLNIGSGPYITHAIVVTAAAPAADAGERGRAGKPLMAIVIDDFGYSRNGTVEGLLALDLPLTCSIIPSLPHSRRLIAEIKAAGKEALLHLPMEPEEAVTYDVAPVTTDMSDTEIEEMVRQYLREMEGVAGVNNHMGSLATQDARVMRAVLAVLKERGLFFLDSLTSPRSIAYNTAREMGIKTARNYLFLDDDTRERALVEERLRRLLERAKRHGTAIGICHPRRWTLEALAAIEPEIKESGVLVVPLSKLVQ